VKVVSSHQLTRDEASKLLQLWEVSNVAQLLGTVKFPVSGATQPGLVFPFYDSTGMYNSTHTHPQREGEERLQVVLLMHLCFAGSAQLASDQVFARYTQQILQVNMHWFLML
jgi:hypothetical protein